MITAFMPWVMSAVTIWMTILAGNKNKRAWLVGLINQAMWLYWIIATQTWGLIPMNMALWIVYARNHWRWMTVSEQGSIVAPTKQVTPKDPEASDGSSAFRVGRSSNSALGGDHG